MYKYIYIYIYIMYVLVTNKSSLIHSAGYDWRV